MSKNEQNLKEEELNHLLFVIDLVKNNQLNIEPTQNIDTLEKLNNKIENLNKTIADKTSQIEKSKTKIKNQANQINSLKKKVQNKKV